jgi:undecaprenyl-diphosphatase
MVLRRKWFTVLMIVVAPLVCYSRIYLACHFPQDILLGAAVGVISALCGAGLFRVLKVKAFKGN